MTVYLFIEYCKYHKMTKTPIERGFYSFDKFRAGDFLLFVSKRKHDYYFLCFPGPEHLYLSTDDFAKSLDTGILSFVEQLPEDIYEETLKFSLSCPNKVTYRSIS